MKTKVIRDWETFDRLQPEWNELLFRSRASSIFLAWEWISAWRAAISDSVMPYVIVVHSDSGKLVGIAPLYLASMRFLKVLPYRMLRFMADVATGSEYPDWIVDPEVEVTVLEAIVDSLAANSGEWDTLWLPKVAGWTDAKDRLLNANAKRRLRYRSRTQVFSQFQVGQTIEVYENSLSPNRRQQLRRNTRKIRDIEHVEFCECIQTEDLAEYLEALFDLHRQRWQALGEEGTFRRKPAQERFYRNFVPLALKNGWLALFGLRHQGELKAVQIGYIFNNVFHQLQEGYDPAFAEGAGNALRHHVIASCIERGVESYDFLGGWSEHKRRWGAETRDGFEIFIVAPKLRTVPLLLREVWPGGRFIDVLGQQTD